MVALPISDSVLVAYVDNELDATTRERVAGLIEQDPAVRERVAMFQRSTELLRAALNDPEYSAVPDGLAARTARMVERRSPRRWTWLALPLAAAIAGLVIGNLALPRYLGLGVGQTAASRLGEILEEVAEYHSVFVREKEHFVEVPAARRDHIQSWLGNRVQYPFTVPNLESRGLAFAGARMLAIQGRPVAQLLYVRDNGERIALCVALTKGALEAPLQSIKEGGYTVFGWATGNHAFIVAGPESSSGLESLAKDLPRLLGQG